MLAYLNIVSKSTQTGDGFDTPLWRGYGYPVIMINFMSS